jgi:hypothetical protein
MRGSLSSSEKDILITELQAKVIVSSLPRLALLSCVMRLTGLVPLCRTSSG